MTALILSGRIKGTKTINQYRCAQYITGQINHPLRLDELVSDCEIIVSDDTGRLSVKINPDRSFITTSL